MSKRFRTFRIEHLEARQMMAGDISAYVQNNTLFLREMAGQGGLDNSVVVKQAGANTIRVTGNTTANGSTSLINGAAYSDFTFGVGAAIDFEFYFGNGNDMVIITEIDPTKINLDDIYINAGVSSAPANRDNDSVLVTFVETIPTGSMSIVTGTCADWVYLDNVATGDFVYGGAVSIQTADGADRVEVYNSTFRSDVYIATSTYGTSTEAYADHVKMVNVNVDGDLLSVYLGGGNDTFLFDRVDVRDAYGFGNLLLDAGAGNDSGTIRNLSTRGLTTRLGEGSDSLSLDYIWANEMDVQGGGGTDSLSKTNIWVDNVFESGWETINGRPAWKS